ncbi:DNA mismatch repair protein MutL [Dickeya dianthicola]|uniref:DNA mismatch repair protein MutL n=1 Tax=Dickeya dianthicola TaxID=204039 RepID=A0ABX9NVA6_9GAMM|nr:DNA mismatch repair endonuclease MutL [Dickeya dianthicola]AYC20678.1 DNA mismatch repair protein MutL [Dickeya dianthicola]MBI0436618.1 DNA mismatch repair endonuclease MutL [Dickeya dianthicola]MBI0447548.1 DNA mismatch repair endonuclease MutL [Dickeya dianthicola]MBI0451830.1 DNA mismatch repair endonuclease MutL [Dickeya dianthicola]MBI0456641.1 DNA mismatch repair endonuclease MutL [Dickeya dianthicola]
MPIQVLPPQLANQIAAGEVVERPASVVKELVENSLDAGATRIDIEIERGGAKLIRIRDNGCGIGKAELALALARHATSKIATLDDLEAIVSLGFRGEALASISSVSRLILTSRTDAQVEAWQAYAEGREMAVTVKPAAHPVGTTLEVLDLFYNTPARRKFLRTEKTEFMHIDEVVRRIALARFDVAITLHHNGKLTRQYRAVSEPAQRERRLGSICGAAFLQHALAVSWQHGDLKIHGWVADPTGSRQLPEMQYCYVNQRMMRDRLINHAIRQAYQDQLRDEQQPAYVLYLEVDPHQVDVNVHPAKHEVRFHQARLVHDFIYQAVMTVLQQAASPGLTGVGDTETAATWQPENRAAAGENQFARPAEPAPETASAASSGSTASHPGRHARERQPAYTEAAGYQKKQGELYQQLLHTESSRQQTVAREAPPVKNTPAARHDVTEKAVAVGDAPLESHALGLGRVLTVYPPSYALVEYQQGLAVLSLTVAERYLRQAQLTPLEAGEGLRPQPLLIPQRLTLNPSELAVMQQQQPLLTRLGIEVELAPPRATLRAVPLPLRQQNLQNLISDLLGYLADSHDVKPDAVAAWIAGRLGSERENWTLAQAVQLLSDVERLCPLQVKAPPSELLYVMDIESAIRALKHE